MAFTDADLTMLDEAIASGIRSVTFEDGRKTEYQSLSDMLAARKAILAAISQSSGRAGRTRFIVGRVRRR